MKRTTQKQFFDQTPPTAARGTSRLRRDRRWRDPPPPGAPASRESRSWTSASSARMAGAPFTHESLWDILLFCNEQHSSPKLSSTDHCLVWSSAHQPLHCVHPPHVQGTRLFGSHFFAPPFGLIREFVPKARPFPRHTSRLDRTFSSPSRTLDKRGGGYMFWGPSV